MKLSDIPRVSRLAEDRAELVKKIAIVDRWTEANPGGLGLTIQSTYQDNAMVKAVQPVVLQELRDRVETIDMELDELGVDGEPAP